jgi:hypothetical protein
MGHRRELVGPEAQLVGRTHGPRILRSALGALTGTLLNAAVLVDGWGVLLTIAVILVYQGGLALGASFLAGALSERSCAR